ncbi:hypothetical protein [Thorsellia anophelis]|nr:hypothetical protein [Thorsellia anophelis]
MDNYKLERLEMNWLNFVRQYDLGFIILTICLSISLVPLDKFIEPLRTELVTTPLLNEEHLSLLPTAYLEHDFKTPYEDVVSVILTSKTTPKIPKTVHNLMNNFINKSKHYACTLPKRLASGQIINLEKTWAPCYFFPLNNEMNDSSRLQFILFGPNYNNIPLKPLSVITVDINSQEISEQPLIFTYQYCSRPWLDSRLNEILKTTPNKLDALNTVLSELIVSHRIPIDNISFGQYKYEVADTTFMCSDYLK